LNQDLSSLLRVLENLHSLLQDARIAEEKSNNISDSNTNNEYDDNTRKKEDDYNYQELIEK